MSMMKLRLGAKGEIVIPKKIRDTLGFHRKQEVVLTVKEGKVEIAPARGEDIVQKWAELARKYGKNVSKEVLYGDKLYEEIFGRKYVCRR